MQQRLQRDWPQSTKRSGRAAHNDGHRHARHRSGNVSRWQVRDHTEGNLKARPIGNNEKTGGTNGGQIKLDGVVFLNLTMGDATSSELVYMTPQVTCFCLSKRRVRNYAPRTQTSQHRQQIQTKINAPRQQQLPRLPQRARNAQDCRLHKNQHDETASVPKFVTVRHPSPQRHSPGLAQQEHHNRSGPHQNQQRLWQQQASPKTYQQDNCRNAAKQEHHQERNDRGQNQQDPQQGQADQVQPKGSPNKSVAQNKAATDPATTKNALQSTCHTDLHNRLDQTTTKATLTRTTKR